MIQKYVYGKPFETEAVVRQPASSQTAPPQLPYLTKEGQSFRYMMAEQDIVYGLGENVRGINKRGWIYVSNCSDDPQHEEHKRSLYGAHNFLVIDGREHFGLFFDYPGIMTFDIGYTRAQELVAYVGADDFVLYVIEGKDSMDIIRQFRGMIGRSYIPPKWAFGYGQSRWSYENEEAVREVARKYRENHIPLDSIYLDIDYMERYKDFTVDKTAFPDLAGLAADMKEQGIHLVPIIDAGVKIEEGYDTYEEGVENGYFCRDKDGENFVVGVWPGNVLLPDVLNEEARRWFGHKYKCLLDQGIEGFWNDMNEPALFYSEKRLKKVLEEIGTYKEKEMGVDNYFKLCDLFYGIKNSAEDYASFYHETSQGRICHNRVHNLYGYNMTRAAGEAFDELQQDKRILLFSRASYIGMHRYGGIWTGDNQSWWSHILLNLKMIPSLNMCGFLYTGADLGGFGCDTTEDLLLRWLQLGVFTPLMRNHSALGTRRQEAYQFEKTESFRHLIALRYCLLPYIYSEFMKAALGDDMMFKPLAFAYPDDTFAREVEDQLLVGESLMIAPVYTQNQNGRYVYLPEDMMVLRAHTPEELLQAQGHAQILSAGHHYIPFAMDELVFFLRPDHILPVAKAAECSAQLDEADLQLLSFVKTKAEYRLYTDDGISKNYTDEKDWKYFCAE